MSLSPATVALRSPSLARPPDESTAVVVGVPLGPWHATRDNPAPDGKKQETKDENRRKAVEVQVDLDVAA